MQLYPTLSSASVHLRVRTLCVYCVCPSYWEGVIKCSSRHGAWATRTVLASHAGGARARSALRAPRADLSGPDKRHLATWLPRREIYHRLHRARFRRARSHRPQTFGHSGSLRIALWAMAPPDFGQIPHSTIGPSTARNPIRPPKATVPQPRPRVLTAPSFGITGHLSRSRVPRGETNAL